MSITDNITMKKLTHGMWMKLSIYYVDVFVALF